jgi:hypothetical protein
MDTPAAVLLSNRQSKIDSRQSAISPTPADSASPSHRSLAAPAPPGSAGLRRRWKARARDASRSPLPKRRLARWLPAPANLHQPGSQAPTPSHPFVRPDLFEFQESRNQEVPYLTVTAGRTIHSPESNSTTRIPPSEPKSFVDNQSFLAILHAS